MSGSSAVTPLKRAARALAQVQSGVDEWDALDETFQANLKEHVRAVLQAIREPSEGMVDAAKLTERMHNADDFGNPPVEDMWQAMIDAALEEG